MSQPVPQEPLPVCTTCSLEPLPQSSQYIVCIIIQCILFFISIKLSIIMLLIGYSISQTIWICPMCKREIEVPQQKASSTKDYLILRLNDFMLLVSKTKFRICSLLLILAFGYWYYSEPRYQYNPRVKIQKTWRSIVSNCGYDLYMDNSYKFKYLYSMYQDTNNWELQGVYLGEQKKQKVIGRQNQYVNIRVKMIPTQFKDSETQDVQLLARHTGLKLEKGDVIKFKGQWSGHRDHVLVFLCTEMEKTDRKITNFQQIQVLSHGLLREHSQ